jgi:hypothetical protein
MAAFSVSCRSSVRRDRADIAANSIRRFSRKEAVVTARLKDKTVHIVGRGGGIAHAVTMAARAAQAQVT